MAITVKNISEMFGKDVFTNKGAYCGRVVDVRINLSKYRIHSLVLEVSRGSFLTGMLGGKKGIIVPYQYVDSIGDVVIIKHISAPALEESSQASEEALPAAKMF